MIILILINIVIIVYIYIKYYKFPETIKETTQDLDDKDSIIIGYINDVGFNNNYDLILAQIIDLNIKGYITIEYNKENTDKYDYTIKQNIDIGSDYLKKYEMIILNFLFSNKTEITKRELEEKINSTFSSYNTQFNEIGEILEKQLTEEKIIDKLKQKELPKKTKNYIKISIIIVLLVSILAIFKIIDNSLLYMLIYMLEKVISITLLLKSSIYTDEGQSLKYKIDTYKIKLEDKEFLTNNTTMKEIVLKKEFANSLALHINTQAKKAFVYDKISKDAIKASKKIIINLLIVFTILVLIGLIMAKITMMLPKGAIFWVYLILAISVACVADITLYKKK